MAADPELVRAWLTARSLARGLPPPVPDHGGFRVDTNSAKEVCRWVFAAALPGVAELGRTVCEPTHFLKLCGTAAELAAVLSDRWTVTGGHWFMALDDARPAMGAVPPGYRLEQTLGAVTRVEIRTEQGELAASGYAAETEDAFVYDRIETAPAHRRRGLARAMMAALGNCRRSPAARQLLTATDEGEKLYSSLGWRKLSAYSTAYLARNLA